MASGIAVARTENATNSATMAANVATKRYASTLMAFILDSARQYSGSTPQPILDTSGAAIPFASARRYEPKSRLTTIATDHMSVPHLVTWHIGLADDEQYQLLLESFPQDTEIEQMIRPFLRARIRYVTQWFAPDSVTVIITSSLIRESSWQAMATRHFVSESLCALTGVNAGGRFWCRHH